MKIKTGIFAKATAMLIALLLLTVWVKTSFSDTQTHNTVPGADANFITDNQTFLEQENAERAQQRIYNVILSGGIGPTDASLTHTITACIGYPNGYYVSQSSVSHTYSALTGRVTVVLLRDDDSRTITISGFSITYDDYFVFAEATDSEPIPNVPDGCLALMAVYTDGSSITSVTDLRSGEIPLKAFASFSAAVDAADNRTIVITDRVRLSSNKTVPAEVTLRFLKGAIMLIDSGVTLTINGSIIAGNYQIFSGSGTVDISGWTGGLLLPDWDTGQISGTTPSVDGIPIILGGEFVSNSNGNPNISDTVFAVDSVVAETAWESIGPTDSGADNIWTAMDSIPAGVDWVRLYAVAYGSNGSASINLYIYAYARETGGSQATGSDNRILRAYGRTDGSGYENIGDTAEITIPLDSSLRFDVYWNGNATAESVDLRLVGWGYND